MPSEAEQLQHPIHLALLMQHNILKFYGPQQKFQQLQLLQVKFQNLRFDLSANGSSMGHLTIKMKHTSATDLTGFDETGWTTVYDMNTSFSATGIQTINLTYPFNYDGTSSILMDISFENNVSGGTNTELNASVTSNNSVVYTNERLGYLNIEAGEWADVDLTNYDFQDQLTITFWANGDPNFLPANTSIMEAYDSLDNRIMNIHFPWSNGSIYWDEGTGSWL
jgi:hypothetical protein